MVLERLDSPSSNPPPTQAGFKFFTPPPPRQEPQSNASGLLGRGREDMGDVEAFNWLVHYALLVYKTKRNQFM